MQALGVYLTVRTEDGIEGLLIFYEKWGRDVYAPNDRPNTPPPPPMCMTTHRPPAPGVERRTNIMYTLVICIYTWRGIRYVSHNIYCATLSCGGHYAHAHARKSTYAICSVSLFWLRLHQLSADCIQVVGIYLYIFIQWMWCML